MKGDRQHGKGKDRQHGIGRAREEIDSMAKVGWSVSWYFEPSQPQRVTSWLAWQR